MKKLLLFLTLLLSAGIAMADQKTMPPEIFISPGEDAYTIDVVGEGEVHLYLKSQDLVTQDWSTEEEVQTHYTIPRTDKPQPVKLRAFAQASGKAKSLEATDGLIIPRTGIEIPAAPEITFILDSFSCKVYATGDGGQTYLFKKEPSGLWGEPNDEGYMYVVREEEEVPLQFKAYSTAWDDWSYYDEENEGEHYFSYDVRGYETRNDYLLPPDMNRPHGEIVFGTPTPDGKLSITYTGNEDVTIAVMLNDNPVELIDGVIQLLPGSNDVYVTVRAEGYLEPIHGWMSYYWHVTTPEPQIIVTPGELEYTVEAVGEGEIHLYCEHYCEYHAFEGEMQNPFKIPRINYTETIHCYAEASLGQGYETSYAQLDVMVPALAQTPEPQIVFTEDETGCEVRAVGQGEVHLYNCQHEEVENPYRILRPYVPDYESYYSNPYFVFYATAQAEGQSESETVEKMIEITLTPWIDVSDGSKDGIYEIQATGSGVVRLYIDGVEVDNPYTLDGRGKLIETAYSIRATAKESGKLTSQVETPLEVSPSPKNANFIHITYDNTNCYVTATCEGYINLSVYCYSTDYDYDEYSAEGYDQVVLTIPREEWNQSGYYYATCSDNVSNNYIYDTGDIIVLSKLLNKDNIRAFLYMTESPDTYFVKSCPQYLFTAPELSGVMINYATPLMLNGEIVDNPWKKDRPEHGDGCATYDFSTVTTLSLVRYDAEKYYIGGKYYPGDVIEFTVDDIIETISICSDTVNRTLFVAEKGWEHFMDGYEYDEYFDSFIEGSLLYHIHVIGGGEPGTHADYAYVGNNRNDSQLVAMIPNHIRVKSYYGTANLFTYGDFDDIFTTWGDIGLIYYDLGNGMSKLQAVSSNFDWGGPWCSTIPVTAIADSAFIGNQSLTGIEIGKNVHSIGRDAFKGCPNLTSVTCWATNPPTMTNVETFDNSCYSNVTLQVPQSSLEKYKKADWWSKFQHIIGVETAHAHGDVNGDNEVNLADVNVLIDAILSGQMGADYDVNDDSEINISDVNALIDIILTAP